MFRHLAPIVGLLLGACAHATGPLPQHKSAKLDASSGATSATVYLNRVNTGAVANLTGKIYLNQEEIGEIKNGQCVKITVPAGQHSLMTSISLIPPTLATGLLQAFGVYNLTTKPGEVVFFEARPDFDLNAGWMLHARKVPSGRRC